MVTIGVTIKEIGIFKKDLFRFQKKRTYYDWEPKSDRAVKDVMICRGKRIETALYSIIEHRSDTKIVSFWSNNTSGCIQCRDYQFIGSKVTKDEEAQCPRTFYIGQIL